MVPPHRCLLAHFKARVSLSIELSVSDRFELSYRHTPFISTSKNDQSIPGTHNNDVGITILPTAFSF